MQYGVAEGFYLTMCDGGLVDKADKFGPTNEVGGSQGDFGPRLVLGKAPAREVVEASGF